MKLHKLFLLILTFALMLSLPAYAHSGRTDGVGGHYNRSTGEYHYHHGYSAHQHPNGVCPYDYNNQTDHSNQGDSETGDDNEINLGSLIGNILWCLFFGLIFLPIPIFVIYAIVLLIFEKVIKKPLSSKVLYTFLMCLMYIGIAICIVCGIINTLN